MSFTLLQTVTGNATATTVSVTLPGTQAGSTLIAFGGTLGAAAPTYTFADTVNGAYTNDVASLGAGSNACALARFSGGAGGSIIVTMTASASGSLRLAVQEWAGMLLPSSVDKVSSGSGISTNPTNTATATLLQAGELGISCGYIGAGQTWTAGSSWTLDPVLATGGARAIMMEYLVAPTTAGLGGPFVIAASETWNTLIATYLPAATSFGEFYPQIPAPGLAGRGRASQFAQPVSMGGMGFMPVNHSTSPGQGAPSGPSLPNVVCGGAFDWILSPTTGLTP